MLPAKPLNLLWWSRTCKARTATFVKKREKLKQKDEGPTNPWINLEKRALLKDTPVTNQQPSAHQFSGLANYKSSHGHGEQTHECLEQTQWQPDCPAHVLLLLPQGCVVQGAIIMVFLILWVNDVPIEKSKVVKHSAAAELTHLR